MSTSLNHHCGLQKSGPWHPQPQQMVKEHAPPTLRDGKMGSGNTSGEQRSCRRSRAVQVKPDVKCPCPQLVDDVCPKLTLLILSAMFSRPTGTCHSFLLSGSPFSMVLFTLIYLLNSSLSFRNLGNCSSAPTARGPLLYIPIKVYPSSAVKNPP